MTGRAMNKEPETGHSRQPPFINTSSLAEELLRNEVTQEEADERRGSLRGDGATLERGVVRGPQGCEGVACAVRGAAATAGGAPAPGPAPRAAPGRREAARAHAREEAARAGAAGERLERVEVRQPERHVRRAFRGGRGARWAEW